MPFPVKINFSPIIDPPQKLPEPSFNSILTIHGNPWGLAFEPMNILNKNSLYLRNFNDSKILRYFRLIAKKYN